jgi:hypothetical protein
MVVHTCNPRTQDAETVGLVFEASLGYILDTESKKRKKKSRRKQTFI